MLQPPESATASPITPHHDGGSGGGATVSSIMAEIGEEDGKGGIGGNRWPRQETLALLKIRSDMDLVFRDSTLKGPLWEEVSRKMADLGFHRSSKKCKEKFENVYKYHKRTKEGRAGKSDGKTYRFFDQLQALESHPQPSPMAPPHPPPPPQAALPITVAMPTAIPPPSINTVPSSTIISHSKSPPVNPPVSTIQHIPPAPALVQEIQNANAVIFPSSPSSGTQTSSSSSTSSDEEIHGGIGTGNRNRKRKRKWKGYFERLMKKVVGKQEDLQKKFLEAIEKREHDRISREEAWKVQEMARLNREHEILIQERSMAAAKDAALISFLQKLSNQHQIPLPFPPNPQTRSKSPPPPPPPPIPVAPQLEIVERKSNGDPSGGGGQLTTAAASPSRWPKAEVEALIKLRTVLDQKYGDTGPKGPLWEEISAEMKKIGYNRNAKRCKEKWENINKYFKKVKESNKKRPEDSKTCPYFHQLDALYRERNTKVEGFGYGYAKTSHQAAAVTPVAAGVEAMAAVPIMARPEQQWPFPPQQNHDEDEEDGNEEDDEEDEEDDDDQGYEIVANTNNGGSMGGAAAAAAASS